MGKFQSRIALLLVLLMTSTGLTIYSTIFTAFEPATRCPVPGIDSELTGRNYSALSMPDLLSQVPGYEQNTCQVVGEDMKTITAVKCDPVDLIVDDRFFASSLVVDFNLLCLSDPVLVFSKANIHLVYLTGMVLGSILFGLLADIQGRVPAIAQSFLVITIPGALSALIPHSSLALFIVGKITAGIGGGGGASSAAMPSNTAVDSGSANLAPPGAPPAPRPRPAVFPWARSSSSGRASITSSCR